MSYAYVSAKDSREERQTIAETIYFPCYTSQETPVGIMQHNPTILIK